MVYKQVKFRNPLKQLNLTFVKKYVNEI